MSTSEKSMKLTFSKLGITIGLLWGLNLFLLALIVMLFGVGGGVVTLLGGLYVGYTSTFLGGLIGLVLGFIHGYVLAIIYNYIIKLF